jgi:TPR repeat protein
MTYGYRENTSYIHHEDTREIVEAVIAICVQEGMQRVARPSHTTVDERALRNNIWGVAVYPGVGGWNIVKSVPFDLLSERAVGADRSRFAQLCGRVKAEGFQLAVHHGPKAWGEVILEANPAGEEVARGRWHHQDSPQDILIAGTDFYGGNIRDAPSEPRFEWLPAIQLLLEESRDRERTQARGDSAFEILCHHIEASLGGRPDGLRVRRALSSGPPLPDNVGSVLHFEWPAGDRSWPNPSERALAEKKLFSEPHFFYADGSPVQPGDAVLFGEAGAPAQVMYFRAETSEELKTRTVRPVAKFDPTMELKPSTITLEGGPVNVPPVYVDQVKTSLKLVERSTTDYVRAGLTWMMENAARDDVNAQVALANQLISGHHIAQDYARAAHWLREAAQHNHAGAQFQLGQLCHQGLGVERSLQEALVWWRHAAEAGRAEAQYTLGLRYERGEGVPQDYAQAVEWYLKAATQGLAQAQCNLGDKYERGVGVPQDYGQALQWYQRAADQGLAAGQFSLGLMHRDGHGVSASPKEAAQWLYRATMNLEGRSLWGEAQYQLGRLYEMPGPMHNTRFAKDWYESAIRSGHEQARERLKQLGVEVGSTIT